MHSPQGKEKGIEEKNNSPGRTVITKEAISAVTYRLNLPPSWKIWNAFHTSLLTPYRETDSHGPNYERPPPDLVEDEEEYEVDQILDSRKHGRGSALQYLV